MHKKNYILFGLLGILLLWLALICVQGIRYPQTFQAYDSFLPKYKITGFPRQLIIDQEGLQPEYILKHRELFQKLPISGFVFTVHLNSVSANNLEKVLPLKQFRKVSKNYKNNFLAFALAEKDLPAWEDVSSWQQLTRTYAAAAALAKKAGFRGVVFDTTAFADFIWNPEYEERYSDLSEKMAGETIYQRARDLIFSVKRAFPESLIVITPAGFLSEPAEKQIYHKYYYWRHFFNGILSYGQKMPVLLLAAESAELNDPAAIEQLWIKLGQKIKSETDYASYWQQYGSFGLLCTFPAEPSYSWQPKISLEQLQNKLLAFQKFEAGYLFLRFNGQAWETQVREEAETEAADEGSGGLIISPELVDALRLTQSKRLKAYFLSKQEQRVIGHAEYFWLRYFGWR